jgi:iron complex transport system ATP-binding protein
MSAPSLSFQEVSFGYVRARPILREMSFELQPGRITAILGPNGCGKTTLLHLALGWLSPWRGEIRLDGRLLCQYPPAERARRMALVPQREQSPFDYTVFDYVLMGRAAHLPPLGMPAETDHAAALQALEQVGMRSLADHPVPQLSGGEHQLMLLARAIAQETPLLLLDEPTAHLDLHNKARLVEMLRGQRARGISLLMSSHEPEVVLALADDILLMEPDGRAQFGPLEQIFTAEALSRIYNLPIRLVDVDGHRQVLWI